MAVHWLTAFVDLPASAFGAASMFWSHVTGSPLSPMRGVHDEFATLVPDHGDAYLRVQRIAEGWGGCHLDLHVDDVAATVAEAVDLGATRQRELDDVTVLRSPAGLSFCIVSYDGESVPPQPYRIDGGPASLVDQLSIDIPPDLHDEECRFWADLTGWEHRQAMRPEYSFVERPRGLALRLLFQRRDEAAPDDRAMAHLDLACADRDIVSAQHEALGARVVERFGFWTTLNDPSGLPYCLLARAPYGPPT